MLELLTAGGKRHGVAGNTLNLDFSAITAGATTFTDLTGKSFSRGGGTASIVADPGGNYANFTGDGGFEGSFPANAFENARVITMEVVFTPTNVPGNTSTYQSLFESGAARTPRILGYLHTFNSTNYELWITGVASNQTLTSAGINGNVKQRHRIVHNITASTITITKYNAVTGEVLGTSTLGTGTNTIGNNGGTTLSIGASWVQTRRFFFVGRIYSMTIDVLK